VTNVALLGLNFDACPWKEGTHQKERGSVIVITH